MRSGAKAIFFANPNAPSGTLVPPETVRDLARRFPGLVLVDEAYADFAGADCVDLVAELPNVVVSRTLSKGYALCGLRLGYAIAAPTVIAQMMKVKDSYNCNAIAIQAGQAALADRAYAAGTWQAVREQRARLTDELTRRGMDGDPQSGQLPAGHRAGWRRRGGVPGAEATGDPRALLRQAGSLGQGPHHRGSAGRE